jgi:hypothetical protein
VEEVKCLTIITSILFLFSSFCFSSVVDPQPLKLRHACGTAVVANARISLISEKQSAPEKSILSSETGDFDFGNVMPGAYRLSMNWTGQDGTSSGPIHNSFPIVVLGQNQETSCKHPIHVDLLKGSESALTVSFKNENK